MKITQILYPGLGGHSSVAFSLIEADDKNLYTHYLLGYGIEEPSEMFISKSKELKISFGSVRKKAGFDISSQKAIYKKLKEQKPNYVIVHSVSLIFTVFIYSIFNKTKWLVVEHQSNHAKTMKDWIYSSFILILSPRIVYLTENYKAEIKAKFKSWVNEKKIAVIPNGINLKKFYPVERDLIKAKLVFSMISRLNSLRDHKTLILAIAEFNKKNPCKLYIAGDGDSKPELEKLVKNLALQEVVIFTGTLNEEGVIELLHNTDIYIHSSLAETLSTSLLQVMACKIPIIATDIKGINDLLIDGKDALLFKAGNEDDLLNKISLIANQEIVQNQLIKNSYRKIQDKYNNLELLNKYLSILNYGNKR